MALRAILSPVLLMENESLLIILVKDASRNLIFCSANVKDNLVFSLVYNFSLFFQCGVTIATDCILYQMSAQMLNEQVRGQYVCKFVHNAKRIYLVDRTTQGFSEKVWGKILVFFFLLLMLLLLFFQLCAAQFAKYLVCSQLEITAKSL